MNRPPEPGHPGDEVSHLAGGPQQGPFVVGLTGPIGCGKSTVAAMLGELGAAVVDADALVREVTAPGEPALAAIRERFGDAVLDVGVLDRAALAGIVFSDPVELAGLEAIIHPAVRRRIEERLRRARRDDDLFVVVEAIKLVEGGLAERCDEVWLIECPASVQRLRLIARGMDPQDADRRIAAQGADLAERLAAHADRRIDTDGSRESVRERVEDALAEALAPGFTGLPWGPVERR